MRQPGQPIPTEESIQAVTRSNEIFKELVIESQMMSSQVGTDFLLNTIACLALTLIKNCVSKDREQEALELFVSIVKRNLDMG